MDTEKTQEIEIMLAETNLYFEKSHISEIIYCEYKKEIQTVIVTIYDSFNVNVLGTVIVNCNGYNLEFIQFSVLKRTMAELNRVKVW